MNQSNKDDMPSEPIHTNSQSHHNTEHDQNLSATAPQRPSSPADQQPSVTYDSNPFSITFQNFSKMFKHAQAVAIVMLVFGIFGAFGNIPSFDSSDFEELRDETSSVLTVNDTANISTGLLAQNDIEQSLIDGANLESNTSTNEAEVTNDLGVAIGTILVIILVLVIAFFTIGLAIAALWGGVVAAAANMAVRDRDIGFGEAFSQSTSRFGTLFVALFIAGLKTIGGYLLLIVPGIRAQARYAALPYVVMGNPSMSATQAVNETKKLYDEHLLESFSITWVGGIIPFVGDILSAVGLAQSARQISDYKSKGLPKPPMSGWNWVAPVVSVSIFGLLFLVLFIVYAAVTV